MISNVDRNKLSRQLVGLERFRRSAKCGANKNGIGTWKWVTGMGKTFAACLLVKKILRKQPKGEVIILVPRTVLKKQWKDTIKVICKGYEKNIKVMTVDYYLYHNLNLKPLLLIVDELHLFYTQRRIAIISGKQCNYTFALGLTGTFEEDAKRHHIVAQYLPIIDSVEEDEAIKEGWISDYVEFNLGYSLEEGERRIYDNYSNNIKEILGYFENTLNKKPFDMVTQCLSGFNGLKPFDIACEFAESKGWYSNMPTDTTENVVIERDYNPNKVMRQAISLMKYVRSRKELLQHSKSKVSIALDIIKKFPNKKIITFSESTVFADTLYRLTNKEISVLKGLQETEQFSVRYHSNLETEIRKIKSKDVKYGKIRLKREALNKIETGEVNVIHTAKALDVGFSVSDMEVSIITSSSSNSNQHTQRGGRVKRKSERGTVIIINVYAVATKDYDTLKSRQYKTPKRKVYWIDDIDLIGLGYVNNERERLTNFINNYL